MTLHGVLYVLLAGSRLQVEHFVQSIEFEEVAVGFAGGSWEAKNPFDRTEGLLCKPSSDASLRLNKSGDTALSLGGTVAVVTKTVFLSDVVSPGGSTICQP